MKLCAGAVVYGCGFMGPRAAFCSGLGGGKDGRAPGYVGLARSGELRERAKRLWGEMGKCRLCPRECGIDRLNGKEGFCEASSQLEVSSYHAHFGEEPELVGSGGSGTIFFTNCSLRCVFCINADISIKGKGRKSSVDELAQMMLMLQRSGCENINFVTPTHYLPHILMAVDKAATEGLRVPLVYNTCGWEKPSVLRFLDGVIDIYLPDFKYSSGEMAAKYSRGAESYPGIARESLLEMHRQVGVASPEVSGLITRGLMIRHLVMPNGVSGTKEALEWIGANLIL